MNNLREQFKATDISQLIKMEKSIPEYNPTIRDKYNSGIDLSNKYIINDNLKIPKKLLKIFKFVECLSDESNFELHGLLFVINQEVKITLGVRYSEFLEIVKYLNLKTKQNQKTVIVDFKKIKIVLKVKTATIKNTILYL